MTGLQVRALIVHPHNSNRLQLCTIGSDLSTLQKLVSGFIEAIAPMDEDATWHAYCNEEGKLRGLLPNWRATDLAHLLDWPGDDVLCGTVIFLGTKGAEEGDVPQRVVRLAYDLGYDIIDLPEAV